MKCSKCETELENGLRFCPHCGEKILEDSAEDGPSVQNGTTISSRFLNNAEFIKVLCLLQAVDGGIDKDGIIQEIEYTVKENKLAEHIIVITGSGKRESYAADKFLPYMSDIIDNVAQFCDAAKERFVGNDDMCDVIMEALYESENSRMYPHPYTYPYPHGENWELVALTNRMLAKNLDLNYFYDIIAGLIEYAVTNDLYNGCRKRFVQHIARRWRLAQSAYSAIEGFASAWADIEKRRQKIMNSDESFKRVQEVLAELTEKEKESRERFIAAKLDFFSSGGGGYGISLF